MTVSVVLLYHFLELVIIDSLPQFLEGDAQIVPVYATVLVFVEKSEDFN